MRRVTKLILAAISIIALISFAVFHYLVPKPGIELVDKRCNPPCIYSIRPGKTTLKEAVTLISQSAPLSRLRLIVGWNQWSLNKIDQVTEDGRLFWNWPSGYLSSWEDTNFATFIASTSKPAVIASVSVAPIHPSTLKAYIDQFGQPTHILPYTVGSGGLSDGTPPTTLVTAYLIYRDKGLLLALKPVPQSKTRDLLNEKTLVTSFTTFALSDQGIQATGVRFDLMLPWKGMQDISAYCTHFAVLKGIC